MHRLIGLGFIDGRQNDWRNLIQGSDYGKSVKDCKDKKYLHIGPHRTGATFLQQAVFPFYREATEVFSNDPICGKLFDNGIENVEKIHALCPDAKFIIVLRNQLSIINSAYRNYVKAGGVWTFPRYAEKIVKLRKYDYELLLNKYFDYYSSDRFLILLYEDLVLEPIQFIKGVTSFIGVTHQVKHNLARVKAGPSKYYNEYLRVLNGFTGIFLNLAEMFDNRGLSGCIESRVIRIRRYLSLVGISADRRIIHRYFRKAETKQQFGYKKVKNKIKNAYSESNKRLESYVGKNLQRYGYY